MRLWTATFDGTAAWRGSVKPSTSAFPSGICLLVTDVRFSVWTSSRLSAMKRVDIFSKAPCILERSRPSPSHHHEAACQGWRDGSLPTLIVIRNPCSGGPVSSSDAKHAHDGHTLQTKHSYTYNKSKKKINGASWLYYFRQPRRALDAAKTLVQRKC